jgi:hypothetical protein
MSMAAWIVIAFVLIVSGILLAIISWYRFMRRWFVVRVRMPLLRRFRYRPARPEMNTYRIQEEQ